MAIDNTSRRGIGGKWRRRLATGQLRLIRVNFLGENCNRQRE
jgi:hypothetical protein